MIREYAATSKLEYQLIELKHDSTEWGMKLKDFLFGADSAFTTDGPKHFKRYLAKPIPAEYKRKYPDIVFALQALWAHVNGISYYKDWEKAQRLLTFRVKYKTITAYRFWHITEDQLQKLRAGETIDMENEHNKGAKYSSFTRHSKLFRHDKKLMTTVMTLNTEEMQHTKGRGLFLVTKHTIAPVFDIFFFLVHLLNKAKRTFGKEVDAFHGISTNYLNERELIGPKITKISANDVLGFYHEKSFNKLDDKDLLVEGFRISKELIQDMRWSREQGIRIDLALFGQTFIVTDGVDPKLWHMVNFAQGGPQGMKRNADLSSLIGKSIYVGHWR